jgi:taurine dioxygenase
MSIEVIPLNAPLGAEIRGLELETNLTAETVAALDKALDDHVVIVVRGVKDLSEEGQLRFGNCFGEISKRKRPPSGRGAMGDFDNPFMFVSNIIKDGKPLGALGDGEMWFHHDTSYYPEPRRATLLYSMIIPTWGGQTMFANMYRAYERLPKRLKDKIEGRKVLQVHDYRRVERLDPAKIKLDEILHHEHPIVITHPRSGRKSLFISRLISMSIVGMEHSESEDILNELADIAEEPSNVYEHEWKVGDLVIWDNWASIHARKDFPRDQQRLMRRLVIMGQPLST